MKLQIVPPPPVKPVKTKAEMDAALTYAKAAAECSDNPGVRGMAECFIELHTSVGVLVADVMRRQNE